MDLWDLFVTLRGHWVICQPDCSVCFPTLSWLVPIPSSVLTFPHFIFGYVCRVRQVLLWHKFSIWHFQSPFLRVKTYRFPSGDYELLCHLCLVSHFNPLSLLKINRKIVSEQTTFQSGNFQSYIFTAH